MKRSTTFCHQRITAANCFRHKSIKSHPFIHYKDHTDYSLIFLVHCLPLLEEKGKSHTLPAISLLNGGVTRNILANKICIDFVQHCKREKQHLVLSLYSVMATLSSLTPTCASPSAHPFFLSFPASTPPICCSSFPSICATCVPLSISTVMPIFTSVLPASLAAPTSVQARFGAARSRSVPAVGSLSLSTSLQLYLILWAAFSTPAPSPLCPCLSIISGLLFRLLLSSARAR